MRYQCAAEMHAFLNDIRNRCHLFYGLAERTMLIGDASNFVKTGIFLERADQMSRLTDVLARGALVTFTAPDTETMTKEAFSASYDHFSVDVVGGGRVGK